MCQPKPGPRCASDTCEAAGQTLEDYIRAWPGGPPVDPVAAAVAVFEHAGASRENLARALGIDASQQPPAPTAEPRPPVADPAPTPEPRPPLDSFGPVHRELGPFQADAWNVPDPATDTVVVEDKTFTRAGTSIWAEWPDGIRIEADRELDNAEIRHLASIVGYAQRSTLRGAEPISAPFRDGPNSFVVYQDATKTYSDDTGMSYERFEAALPDLVREGTPVRKTDRAGAGTKGTRTIDGLGDLGVSIWYDSVGTAG